MEDKLLSAKEKDKQVTEDKKELCHNQVEELRCSIDALLAENDVFECHIGRLNLQGEGGSPKTLEDSQQAGGGVERRQQIFSNLSAHSQLLTLEQKLHVVQKEVNDTEQDQKKLQLKYENILDNYKASVKEAEVRLAEISKAKIEFEHKQLKSLKNRQLEMKEPEMVLQYIKDRSKVTQLEKFTLRNQALKVRVKKLLQQLHPNKESRNADDESFFLEFEEPKGGKSLNELQESNFDVQRVLSLHKEKLQSVTLHSTELSKQITKRNQLLAKMDKEMQRAEKDRLKVESLNKHLRQELADYEAPDIPEYMNVKERQKKLQQNIHTWERKVGIAEMVLKMRTREDQAQSPSYSCKQQRVWK